MRSVVGSPRIPASCSLIRLGVWGENQTFDLVTLMSWLDDSQKFNSIPPRFLQSLTLALVKRKISSVKNKCDRRTRPLKDIGWINLLRTASSNLIDNRSKQRINRYGERGLPYRIPRQGTTFRRGDPFHRMWNLVEVIVFMMRVMRV